MKYAKKKKKQFIIILKENVSILPIIFMASILPLISHMKMAETRLTNFTWFSDEKQRADFFLYYKQVWFLVVAAVMLCIFSYYIIRNKSKIKIEWNLLPLLIYGLLALLSTLLSPNRMYGFLGAFEQYESIFVQLGYILIVFYCFYFFDHENKLRLFLQVFMISVFIMGLIGTFQTFGMDFFQSPIGVRLLLPSQYWANLEEGSLSFLKNTAYMTLYNPNYVGVYASLILPILFSLFYTSKEKWIVCSSLINMVLITISLFGSGSKAGLIAVVIGIFVSLIFLRKYLIKKFYFTIIILVTIVLLGFVQKNMLIERVNIIYRQFTQTSRTEPNLTGIETGDKISIIYKGEPIYVCYRLDGELLYLDVEDKSQKIAVIEDYEQQAYILEDERFPKIAIIPIQYREWFAINIKIDGKEWMFTNDTEDGTYSYINRYGKLDKIITADSAVFTKYPSFATGRGYIWSRTIPLLKDKILIGSGAETFTLEFPQQDYIGLMNNGYTGLLMTKPHSLYLQQGVQFGALAVILFVIFILIYLASSFKLYIKGEFGDLTKQLGMGIFVSITTYMIVSITNDSSIAISPVFWSLTGIGIAINTFLCKKILINENTNPTATLGRIE